jgi:hypothetical protein
VALHLLPVCCSGCHCLSCCCLPTVQPAAAVTAYTLPAAAAASLIALPCCASPSHCVVASITTQSLPARFTTPQFRPALLLASEGTLSLLLLLLLLLPFPRNLMSSMGCPQPASPGPSWVIQVILCCCCCCCCCKELHYHQPVCTGQPFTVQASLTRSIMGHTSHLLLLLHSPLTTLVY